MNITGKLVLNTDGKGIYEATVNRDDLDVQAAVDELEQRMEIMLAESASE